MLNDLNPDFQDLINCLTYQKVEFLIVGAHALAFHGVARYTKDLDLWIRRTAENAQKLRLALDDFGVPISEGIAHQLVNERKLLRLGHEPQQVDILNFADGCEYESASSRACQETFGDADVFILSLQDYVATKRASGRPKDLSDLVLLRGIVGPLPGDPRPSI